MLCPVENADPDRKFANARVFCRFARFCVRIFFAPSPLCLLSWCGCVSGVHMYICMFAFCDRINCPDEEMARRIVERGKGSGRADDHAEAAKVRINTYHQQSSGYVQFHTNSVSENIYIMVTVRDIFFPFFSVSEAKHGRQTAVFADVLLRSGDVPVRTLCSWAGTVVAAAAAAALSLHCCVYGPYGNLTVSCIALLLPTPRWCVCVFAPIACCYRVRLSVFVPQAVALLRLDRAEVRGPGRNAARARKHTVSPEPSDAELNLLQARPRRPVGGGQRAGAGGGRGDPSRTGAKRVENNLRSKHIIVVAGMMGWCCCGEFWEWRVRLCPSCVCR